jgi:hypothetical protein
MIVIPKEKPVIENLNSYYVDVRKLFEHYQGELGAGGIHFKSLHSEGVVFFDKDDFLNGVFADKGGEVKGQAAIDKLVNSASEFNFSLSVYAIEPDKLYFWANIPNAMEIYKDLSTEFTDLEGLVKKMISERLTGYIDVSIGQGEEGGIIFLSDGAIIGGSYSWGEGEVIRTEESRELLLEKTKEKGGTFQVCRISLAKEAKEDVDAIEVAATSPDVLEVIKDLLGISERLFASRKEIKADFTTLLKKKFVDKANQYAFLDPFAGEFEYADQEVNYTGNASEKELAGGVAACVRELAEDLGILDRLREELAPWSNRYSEILGELGVSI